MIRIKQLRWSATQPRVALNLIVRWRKLLYVCGSDSEGI